MKVLFLCRGNTGRSVFAQGLYNKLTNSTDAVSAGTQPGAEGDMLADRVPAAPGIQNVIDAMEEEGVDVSRHARRLITEDMLGGIDVLVDMSEPGTAPDYVNNFPNRIVWHIENPKGADYATHVAIKDSIKSKVVELINN